MVNNNNEEYAKNYLINLGKSLQSNLESISNIDWGDPSAFIRMGELTTSLRKASESAKTFLEELLRPPSI